MKPRSARTATPHLALAGLVLLGVVLSLSRPAHANEGTSPADSLSERITSLRQEGGYAEAVDVARDLLALRRSDATAKPYQVADAERLVATMETAAALPEEGRKNLAEADRLDPEIAAALAAGRYAAGVEKAQRQVAIRRRLLGEEHPDIAESLNSLAQLLQARGDYAGAEPLYRETLAMRRKLLGDEHPYFAGDLNNLATLLMTRGDYAGAEPLFRESLAISRRLLGEEHLDVATDLNNLAGLLQSRGDYAGAEPLFRESLAMRRKLVGDEHPYVARALNNLARLLLHRGDYAGAEPLFRESLAMCRKVLGEAHPDVATVLNNLAQLLQARGDYAGAEPLYREALAMRRKLLGEEHPAVAQSLNNLAFVLQSRGDYAGAEGLHREALAIRRRLLGETHPDVATSLRNLGWLLCRRRSHVGAESSFAQAAAVFESARLRVGSGAARSEFAKSPYPGLAATRLELGREAEAWQAAERALARALGDLLRETQLRVLSRAETAREDSLRLALGDAERKHTALREAARKDSTSAAKERAETARNELLEMQARWSALQQELSGRHLVEAGEPYSLERVQRSLGSRTAILGWLDVEWKWDKKGEVESWGYVIRKQGPVRWAKLKVGEGTPAERGKKLREASVDRLGIAAREPARALYRERLAPLEPFLKGVEELVVLPSGGMLGVPVEALGDSAGVSVGERYAVSYSPSATIYAWLREKEAPRSGSHAGLFLGDPVFSREETMIASAEQHKEPGLVPTLLAWAAPVWSQVFRSAVAGNAAALDSLPPLPKTREEVEDCARFLPGSKILLSREATEQALVGIAETRELARYRVLHFATHALTDDERPEQSSLVLSRRDLPDDLAAAMEGRRIYDGLLSAQEIVREWDLDADLVVLSGCETGLGKEVAGEGYLGLATAFLQRGARSLLVSLWRVEDRSTSLLMSRFYENWTGSYVGERAGHRGPMPKARALREAKEWLRTYRVDGARPYAAPLYWAGFILLGDPS